MFPLGALIGGAGLDPEELERQRLLGQLVPGTAPDFVQTFRGGDGSEQQYFRRNAPDGRSEIVGATSNGKVLDISGGLDQALDADRRQRALDQGRVETGVAGVPSADFLSTEILGRAMPGGSPFLDQRRMQQALRMQEGIAGRAQQQQLGQAELDNRRQIEEMRGRNQLEQQRLQNEGALQAAGANQARQQRDVAQEKMDAAAKAAAFEFAQKNPGATKQQIAQVESRFKSTFAAPQPPAAAAGAAAAPQPPAPPAPADLADQLMSPFRQALADPKDPQVIRPLTGVNLANFLTGLDANAMTPEALSAFAEQVQSGGLPGATAEEVENALANVIANSFLSGQTRTTVIGGLPDVVAPGFENLRLERDLRRWIGPAFVRRFLGSTDYDTLRFPAELGGRQIPLEQNLNAVGNRFNNHIDRANLSRQGSHAASLLNAMMGRRIDALRQAQQGVR